MKSFFAVLAAVALVPSLPAADEVAPKPPGESTYLIAVRGSLVVARALAQAKSALEKDNNIALNFVPEADAMSMIDRLGMESKARQDDEGKTGAEAQKFGNSVFDVALFTRPMTGPERALHPERKYTETLIGKQAVLAVVPEQVWRNGVRALTKEQFRDIYERETTNWKKLGGEDREIVYYNREVNKGIWDLYMIFLYGSVSKAPISKAETLNNASDVATAVEFNVAAISLMEYGEFQGTRLKALGIKLDDGTIVEPTTENIASGKYPLARSLYLITGRLPTGKLREFLEFMTGPVGQAAVKKAGHVTLAEMKLDKP